jgi:hypothetical protein
MISGIEGIGINPGEVSLAVLVVWGCFWFVGKLLGNQRSESEGDQKIILTIVQNFANAMDKIAVALDKNTESNNRIIADSAESRERNRKDAHADHMALIGSLESMTTAINVGQTDIKSRMAMVVERIEIPLTDILAQLQKHEPQLALIPEVHAFILREKLAFEQQIALLKEAHAKVIAEPVEIKVDAALKLETPGEGSEQPPASAEGETSTK